MTRARALKAVIRARAAKTGERYTAARRHVLNSLNTAPQSAPPAPPSTAKPKPASAVGVSRGAVSDASARAKTGHGLDHWFKMLERFGGIGKGHTAMARHLSEAHGVPGWYAQGITVAFERARGARAVNQRCDGEYEISVSKVIGATTAAVVEAVTDERIRRRWIKSADAQLAAALAAALESPASKGVVVRPDGQARYRYKWADTTVQINVLPKAGNKVSFVVTNGKLADAKMVEDRRAMWRVALTALARTFTRA